MNTITLVMLAAAPGLPLLALGVAWALGVARPGSSDQVKLMLFRGLVWAFGAAAAAYLGVLTVLLAKGGLYGFTWAAGLPFFIFAMGAATTIWHIRNLERQISARSRTKG